MRQPAHEGNRLSREISPYLLQHASNPVDWYPWGDEAFAEARRRDVPIFLSIGYSTCYWCHVMERESFENERIARAMSERFVCIKVDREERPDIDEIYMAATVLMTGRGGWPMSCFLEPERLRPFWCGTYFPAQPRPELGSLPSFPQVLDGIAGAWKDQREQVMEQARRVADAVSEQLARSPSPVPLGIGHVQDAVGALLRGFDRTHGGIGGAPKFPQPVFLDLLLRVRETGGDEATLSAIDQALRVTLDRMGVGGIFDQVGGGFHRYSVDATWTIPHFEKMLYDQAQLIRVYARASALYDDAYYALIARRCCDYLLREMASPEGGFFSAQDAEVDHREGRNYLWTPDEIRAALAADDAELAIRAYGLDLGANFRDPHHADEPASNVLRLRDRPDAIADDFAMSEDAMARALERINAGLLRAREKRKQAATDDKVLAGWNGLAIAALSDAGRILGEARFIEGAARAAEFVLREMVRDGVILRSWRLGTGRTPGFLEDSAFLIEGLLALHEASGRVDLVDHAMEHVRLAREAFGDARGGFFDTRDGQSDLFVRSRSTHDGAVPSAAGVMLHNLVTLHEITRERAFLDQALASLRSLSPAINDNPIGSANGARALLRLLALGADREDRITFGDRSGTPAIDPAPSDPAFTPVEVFASDDRVEVGKDRPGSFELRVRIAPGCHIVAADPGAGGAGLIPTRVHVLGGTGVAVFADYPKGERYPPGAGDGPLVYRGTIEMTVALERAGAWSGRPIIAMTYQACTDTECLSPRTIELDVAIDRID